jgi:hypothetical protein
MCININKMYDEKIGFKRGLLVPEMHWLQGVRYLSSGPLRDRNSKWRKCNDCRVFATQVVDLSAIETQNEYGNRK